MSENQSSRPREDLCDRYQEVIEIQTKSIRNFDDKTWRSMRVTGIIGGIGVASLSYAANADNVEFVSGTPVKIALSISLLCFLASFGLGIRSYKSAEFATAPNTELGTEIQSNRPDPDEYRSTVVGSYVDAIERNNNTLRDKKKRFRLTLASLLVGIWTLAVAIVLGAWSPDRPYLVIVIGVTTGAAATYFALYFNFGRSGCESGGGD